MVSETAKHREARIRHTERNRKLLQDYAKYEELRNNHYDVIEYVELNPPLQTGWTRTYVVRSDIAKSSEGDRLKELLTYIHVTQFSRTRDFLEYHHHWWRTYNRKGNKTREMSMEFESISERKYLELPEYLKKYFYKYTRIPRWGSPYDIYRCSVPLWKFTKKISPFYIKYLRRYNTKLESEYQRMRNHFETNNLWGRIWHIQGSSGYNDDWYDRPWDLEKKIALDEARREAIDYMQERLEG
jgi:hypothetical protein